MALHTNRPALGVASVTLRGYSDASVRDQHIRLRVQDIK